MRRQVANFSEEEIANHRRNFGRMGPEREVPVSKKWTMASGMSRLNASAPRGRKKGSGGRRPRLVHDLLRGLPSIDIGNGHDNHFQFEIHNFIYC